jgi:hypothetical protein
MSAPAVAKTFLKMSDAPITIEKDGVYGIIGTDIHFSKWKKELTVNDKNIRQDYAYRPPNSNFVYYITLDNNTGVVTVTRDRLR